MAVAVCVTSLISLFVMMAYPPTDLFLIVSLILVIEYSPLFLLYCVRPSNSLPELSRSLKLTESGSPVTLSLYWMLITLFNGIACAMVKFA